jgi:hypothetical protein
MPTSFKDSHYAGQLLRRKSSSRKMKSVAGAALAQSARPRLISKRGEHPILAYR